jgi:hypothetical protein
MVAGLLDAAGYNTGDNYLTPRSANPEGFFEDEAVNRLNDRLLGSYMPKRYGWRLRKGVVPRRTSRSGPGFLAVVPLTARFAGEDETIRSLVSHTPFAYKDPRLCWTLDAWRPHVPADTGFVCVFREPGRAVESMVRLRDLEWYVELGLDRRWALATWISAYRHVLDRHRDRGDWIFLHYDQVLTGEGVRRLEEFLDVSIDVDTRKAASFTGHAIAITRSGTALRAPTRVCDLTIHAARVAPNAGRRE